MVEQICNICNFPKLVEMKDETGKVYRERVTCLDHTGVLPYLWNRHPDFTMHEQFRVRQYALIHKK